jgi:hypothetical protein
VLHVEVPVSALLGDSDAVIELVFVIVADADIVTLGVGAAGRPLALTLPSTDGPWEPLSEAEREGLYEALKETLPVAVVDGLSAREADTVMEGVGSAVGVMLGVKDMDGVRLGVKDGVTVLDAVNEGVKDMVTEGVGVNVREKLMDIVLEDEGVIVLDTLMDSDPVRVTVTLAVMLGVRDGVIETVRVTVPVRLDDTVLEEEPVDETDGETVTVTELLTVEVRTLIAP